MKIVCKKATSSSRGGKFFARGIFPTPLRARGPPGDLAKRIKTTPLPFVAPFSIMDITGIPYVFPLLFSRQYSLCPFGHMCLGIRLLQGEHPSVYCIQFLYRLGISLTCRPQ